MIRVEARRCWKSDKLLELSEHSFLAGLYRQEKVWCRNYPELSSVHWVCLGEFPRAEVRRRTKQESSSG